MRSNSELKNSIPVKECLSFEFEHAGDCWQADSSHRSAITVAGKKVTTCLISFQDDASRMIVHGEFLKMIMPTTYSYVLKKQLEKQVSPSVSI